MTREEVIKGLRCCRDIHEGATLDDSCNICPYQVEKGQTCVADKLFYDAITLLKEQEPPTNASILSAIECLLHPQDADDSDMSKAIDTAVRAMRLLRDQEPRVLTLEEVKSAWRNRNIAFLVEYNDGGNPVWMLYYGYLSTLEEIVLIDEIAHLRHFGVDGYGVDWRCWTSRPTEEQRKAAKWDESI